MQRPNHLALGALLGAVMALASGMAAADPVIADVNGSATPGSYVFGPNTIGWKWTASQSFIWDGLGSSFYAGSEYNVLSPSIATLLIATDTPAAGGSTLYSGNVDGAGHASFGGIAVTAGTTYFIGYSGLHPAGNEYAVGINIVKWEPSQPAGTVNLDGWYTGDTFASFSPQINPDGSLNVFSAPILRFEGHVATTPPVPEPETYALMALGLIAVGAAARRRR